MISACLTPLLWNTFHALCFSDMQISKTGSKTRMQHKPRPGGEITQCILVVTPLAFWACDWSILPIETLLLRMGISEQFTIPELAELSPDCRILFCFFPTMHCTWKLLQKNKHLRITKKRHSLKNQGGPHIALSSIWHWKSTIYHFITLTKNLHNNEQQIF